ncbi:MAG: hypothetical protein GC151_04395 [Betaproteobacteria bacterium]|nr:hypothetical protein [Betaproteobacteria bacterium]
MTSSPMWSSNPGTEQSGRLPVAMGEGYFLVDETGVPDLAAMAAEFSRYLAFVDLRNRPAGTWEPWFAADEAFVLATILGVNVDALRGSFLHIVDSAPVEMLVLRIVGLARRLDRWYRTLGMLEHRSASILCEQIRRMADGRLAAELQWVTAWAPSRGAVAASVRALDDSLFHVSGRATGETAEPDRSSIRSVFFSFLESITQLRETARERLDDSLGSDRHDPSAALLLGFLRLFGTAQRELNAFTARHTDFYYRDCLRLAPRPATPDSIHLVCERVPTTGMAVTLPRGTPFVLGRDASGRDIVYRTEEGLDVTPVRVEDLRTLRLERDPLISPERELGYVTRARAACLPTDDADLSVERTRRHWPLFGGSGIGENTGVDAELGFAIASPLLFLREGSREVRVRLDFDDPTDLDAAAGDQVVRFLKSTGRGRCTLAHLVARLFKRFLRSDGVRIATVAKRDGVSLRAMVLAAAPRIATKVLVRRIAALPEAEASAWRRAAADEQGAWVVKSARALVPELRGAIEAAIRDRLGQPVARLAFEVDEHSDRDIALFVGGREALPGGEHAQRSGYDVRTAFSAYVLQRLLDATAEHAFFRSFGRLFCRWMLLDPAALLDCDVVAIKQTLRGIPRRPRSGERPSDEGARDDSMPDRADVLSCIRGDRAPVRDFVFNKVFLRMFDVSLTSADGWLHPTDTFVTGADSPTPEQASALTIVTRLPPEAAAVVAYDPAAHGGDWRTTLPVIRVRLKPGSTMYSYSLLADVVLTAAHLDVDVRDARDAVLHNHLGRLDPSKPFNPFGPMPARGSYLVFGSAEVARKSVTRLSLNIEWGGLPDDEGGFRAHYRGYGGAYHNEAFRVAVAVLRDGRWTHPGEDVGSHRLFEGSRDGHRVRRSSSLEIDAATLRNDFRPVRAASATGDFEFDLAARSGFFRFVLAEPADPFGHKAYPQLLTKAVSANARRRRQGELPNTPYTPLVERLTYDYSAQSSMNLAREIPAERSTSDDEFFLIQPFGAEEIYPAIRGSTSAPIPRFECDGNLFIGLSAEGPPGLVSLLFHLRDESARRATTGGAAPRVRWFYLASNRWHALPAARVVADSTHGFLTSGIVTLDIPDDIDRRNTILPAGCFWIRVGTDSRPEVFAGLYSVRAQAVRATRETSDAGTPVRPQRSGTVAEPVASVPGLARVVQVGRAFGGRAPEDGVRFRARAGERLRHKNRAAVHWDYERLVLDGFPDVFNVKCFGSLSPRSAQAAPGAVTIVVVPAIRSDTYEDLRAPKLNAVELERIRAYVQARTSPFARITVRNAAYERIQVQCAVRFTRDTQGGRSMQRLNQDIIERLSPWRPHGMGARFDWIVRKDDVEAWLRDLDYVETVARVSLLQISEDDDTRFVLGDSARARRGISGGQPAPEPARRGTLVPRYPWSLAIPTARHAIELMSDDTRPEAAPTGIAGLEIGNTFIISGARDG